MWGELSKAIIGIGSNFSKTPLIKLGAFSKVELTKLLNYRQVGDILTQYFNLKGEFCELSIYKQIVNFPIKRLKEVGEVIAVAGGINKKYSIIGALRSGLIDTIILDGITAQEIIREVGSD
jgi:DNA-binding transcriptional regulator LsrR (DeoR family)